MEDLISFDIVEPGIAVVSLNRATKKNAINGEMTAALSRIHARIEHDPSIRAAILTSSSPSIFCSGADLKEVADGNQDALVTETGGFAGFVREPKTKPWIAAMDGHAIAGGLEIALACHIRVVGSNARLGLPEPRYGMIAGAGGVDRLPRLIPHAIAIELLCTGELIDAERAYRIGLVNHLVPEGEAMAKAVEIAHAICRNAPLAVNASLRFAELSHELPASELVVQMTVEQKRIYGSQDFVEGTRSFVEKREPQWSGR
ncbi:enoyl-CoA hydratase-related protein [Microvirga tunisiensis]|uniref:Enoyl-CoA hydratase n=1 Tax=Microvirga tunisiensis TaxID=2108360 RepID=A0A5N7MJ70_9HYPH|nr:enoyl-CoA hydratase-related protein [Microvirga tunisiensis]MPR07819.1 enoyl-CoA hydratase [Microvirga tunisiensis]MPR26214.1 enoyl-CoA hydratase [Microvirga tunisiensis]